MARKVVIEFEVDDDVGGLELNESLCRCIHEGEEFDLDVVDIKLVSQDPLPNNE